MMRKMHALSIGVFVLGKAKYTFKFLVQRDL